MKWAEVREDFLFQVARKKPQCFSRFHRRSGQNNTSHLFLLQCCHSHRDCKISFARTSRSNPKNNVMLLDRFYVCSLVGTPCYDRRLAGRGYYFGRNNVTETLIALFSHGLERVIEFVFLNVNALLPSLLKLLKNLLGFVD